MHQPRPLPRSETDSRALRDRCMLLQSTPSRFHRRSRSAPFSAAALARSLRVSFAVVTPGSPLPHLSRHRPWLLQPPALHSIISSRSYSSATAASASRTCFRDSRETTLARMRSQRLAWNLPRASSPWRTGRESRHKYGQQRNRDGRERYTNKCPPSRACV
jgi:hypothetical protein